MLFAAADAGFTHFDTSPYYGFGVAERELGALLAARPELTVATKAGLYAPGGENASNAAIIMRKAAGKIFPALTRPIVDLSVARARASLDASLKRLRRERVDLFFLHEPEVALLQTDEWLRWLEAEDRVRHFGIALASTRLKAFLETDHPLARVVQTQDSLEAREADVLAAHGRPMQLTYGYLSSRDAAGRADAASTLAAALARNAAGSIVVSTTKLPRLQQYLNVSNA